MNSTRLIPSRYRPEPADPHAFDVAPPLRDIGPIGVVMVNLGTPGRPDAASIRRYLRQFLSDPRVIELPAAVWKIILYGLVLPLRPRKLVPRYRAIWDEKGSPLLVRSLDQAERVKEALLAAGVDARLELGMRYGEPSLQSAFDRLRDQGCERILVVPMYPQYAASTTATVVDEVGRVAGRLRNQPELRFIKRFHNDPAYIGALAGSVREHWQAHGRPDRLLLSFHGLPKRSVEQGDPYHRDCMETAAALRHALGEDGRLVHVSFQSRFGAQEWLQPYTQPMLEDWARQGMARCVDVMCPGFLADCLETLEEIQIECRDAFLAAGGEQYRYIPCLNGAPGWGAGFAGLIRRHLAGWL